MTDVTESRLKLESYEIRDYGVDHSQYFQGAGVAYTIYDHVFVGAADTFAEALEDACEQAASYGYDTLPIETDIIDDSSACDGSDEHAGDHECELYRFVGLFVRRAIA